MVEDVFWNKQLFKYFKNEQKDQQSIKQFQLNTISYSKVFFFKTYFFSISISYMQILYDQKQPPEVFYKKVVLRRFTKFTGKHLCQRCFPVNFVKFLRTLFLQNTSGRLLPYDHISKMSTSISNCLKFKDKTSIKLMMT